jgi:hypothetical protein
MKSIPLAPKQPARHGGRLVSTVGVVGAGVVTGWVVGAWVRTSWVVDVWAITGWVVGAWASLPPHALSTTSTQEKIAAGDFIVMVRHIPRRKFGSLENIGDGPLKDDI